MTSTISEDGFSLLLNNLWNGINLTVDTNLKSGFQSTEIHPFDPEVVPSMLPTTSGNKPLKQLLSKCFQGARGNDLTNLRQTRGKKILSETEIVHNIQTIKEISVFDLKALELTSCSN